MTEDLMKRIKELEAERDEREEEAEYWHGKWKEIYAKVDHEVSEALKAAANGLCGLVKKQDTRIAELEERIMELESELDG